MNENSRFALKKILATVVDILIMLVVTGLLMLPSIIYLVIVTTTSTFTTFDIYALYISSSLGVALSIISSIAYLVVVPSYTNGQTIGYIIFKLRLINNNNEALTSKVLFVRATTRLVIIILTLGVCLIADLLVLLLNKRGISFYDVLTSTHIIDISSNKEDN